MCGLTFDQSQIVRLRNGSHDKRLSGKVYIQDD